MAGKKKGGVRAKENKDELSTELIATEPVIARRRGRSRISQCSHSKIPSCDDQQVDPVIENSKGGESNNSHNQDGEKSVSNFEENVKQFTQMLQGGMRDVVAKCDELQNENHDLRKKLESSLAKVEEYEKANLLLSESIKTFSAWFASSPTILKLGLSSFPSSTDSRKPPESRKAAGDIGEAPPIAMYKRRKLLPRVTK